MNCQSGSCGKCRTAFLVVAQFIILALQLGPNASRAYGQVNLVPNPGFETGPHEPVSGCFTDNCQLDVDFDDRIDNWKAAILNPNAICVVAIPPWPTPDWITLSDITGQCASAYSNMPGNANTSDRLILMGSREGDGYAEGIRVGLMSPLSSGTLYILRLRASIGMTTVPHGAHLRLHLTKWSEHWHSSDNDNISLMDFVNFEIPPNSPHQWYELQHVFSVPADKDDELQNLVIQAHYSEGAIWFIDDVSLESCAASIVQQPQSSDGFAGDTMVLSCEYSGPESPSFQWRKLTGPPVDLNDARHSGANSSTMTITDVTTADSGQYEVLVTYPCGQLVSDAAVLTVCDGRVTINQQPPALINFDIDPFVTPPGSALEISVSASGPDPVYYHWYSATHQIGLIDGPRISGTDTPTLTIDPVEEGDAGIYFVSVSSDCEDILSQYVTLNVISGSTSAVSLPSNGQYSGIAAVSPNPFNPLTVVTFNLVEAHEVEIAAYDTQGRLVGYVAKGEFSAGSHDVVWDASSQSSGTYLLRMTAGHEVSTRKIALVR